MIKSFTKYILTLVAILMVTSNAWAATATWNGGVAVGAGKGSATVELYKDNSWPLSDTQEETKTSTNSTVASFNKLESTSLGNWTINSRYMKFSATKADGYEFAGWFSNAACTQSYSTDNPYQTSSDNKSLDLTLYAKFTPHTYTVNYNGNGATSGSMNSQTLVFDEAEKLNANQYKRIYTITYINDEATSTNTATATYTGWSTNANGTGTSYTDQADMRNFLLSNNAGTLNLYAKWTLANITLPSPTKEGYILEGWYDSNGKVGNAGDKITPTSDMTLTAYWIQKFTPNLQGPSEIAMQVADTTLADFIFENVSQDKPSENSGDFHFTITHSPDNTSKEGSPNRNLVISYDPSTNNIIALNSGTATITFIQEEIDTYYTDTLRSTITVSKQATSFTLNFADEYYVDDEINKSTFFTNSNNNEVAISVSDSEGYFTYSDNTLKANGDPMPSGESHTTTITVTQAENYKWTKQTLTKQITLKRHTISAKINQTTAVWNELINNPFSASSTHPVSGQVTPINDFTVTQEGNEHIAQLNNSNYNIQTYYTDGLAQFKVKRDEDYKYNPLNQTFDLNVQKDKNGCYAIYNASTKNDIVNKQNATSEAFPLIGAGNTLTFKYKLNSGVGDASNDHYITPQYSVNGKDFTPILKADGTPYIITTRERNEYTTSEKIVVPQDATHINFLRTAAGSGNRTIKITEINVTRASFLTPSVHTLILDPTIKNKLSEKSFTVDWSTCADEIKVMSNNQYLTINISKIDVPEGGGRGTAKITVSCQTDVIQKHEGVIAIFDNTQMIEIPISCEVKDLTVPEFKGDDEHKMEVSDTWEANFEFIRTQSYIPTFSETAESTGFYYYIEHNVTTDNTTGSEYPDKVIQYNPTYDPNTGNVTNNITALNEGTAILHIIQKANNEYEGGEFTCTLTVSKRTPVFTWNDPVYFNQTTVSDYFITNNTDTDIKIESQSDTDVAELYFNPNNDSDKHTLDLTTYYKETTPASSTTVTVSQAENYKWNDTTATHTITPENENKNNHVQFTLTQENYIRDFQVEYLDPAANNKTPMGPDWQDGGIYFGGAGLTNGEEGWNWSEKYIIIKFSGIPDKLTFDASRSSAATGTIKLSVSEGTNKDNLTEIWSNSNNSTNDSIECKLNPETRFLKFSYTGNLWGLFKNITVTELNLFQADPAKLDFGRNQVDKQDHPQKTFALHYANAGYKVKLESTNPKFTISPNEINSIGGEIYGTYAPITVTYNTDEEHITNNDGKIIITDEVGHYTEVELYGYTYKIPQSLYWTENWQANKPAMQLNTTATDVARATSTLPVTYTSSDETVIRVIENGTKLEALKEGTATITASQQGNDEWAAAESISKEFVVTSKIIQYVHWTDNLQRLLTTDEPITLNAKIQLEDSEGNRVDSPERTQLLEYYSLDENIVSINGNSLTIIGEGETYVIAYEIGDEKYEQVYLAMPVRVRKPSEGCEPIVLYQPDEIDFFQWNTNQIIKDAIEIDRSKGIPGYLSYQHKGERWISFYKGTIKAQQSTDGGNNWNDIPSSQVTPTVNEYKVCENLQLSEDATHIRFVRPTGGQGYHYVKDIEITPAQFIRSSTPTIDFGEMTAGSVETKEFTISYSNMQSEFDLTTSSTQLTLANHIMVNDCGSWGEEKNYVTFKPTTAGQFNETIIIKDDISEKTCTIQVKANVIQGNQRIVWTPKTTELNASSDWCSDCELATKNAYSTVSLPITYTIVESTNAYFDQNGLLVINQPGEITITALQEGNENFKAAEPVSKTFNIATNTPLTFIGGQENKNWDNPLNWNFNRQPGDDEAVTVQAETEISTHITSPSITIAEEGIIHILSNGGLTVGEQGIANANNDGSSIIIENTPEGSGFLRVDPNAPNKNPYFTMNYQTRGYNQGVPRDETWQYMGAPGNNARFKEELTDATLIYHWNEQQGWVKQSNSELAIIPTWQGYALTQSIGENYTYPIIAQAMQGVAEITLTCTSTGMKGDNLFVNSFAAPIDITKITTEDLVESEKDKLWKIFYLFNAGSWNQWKGDGNHNITAKGYDQSSAGHYYTIPILSAQYTGDAQTIIPPMQGVYVYTETPATIRLNYDKHVWSGTMGNQPMRSPALNQQDFLRARIHIGSENSGADRMYIIQEASTTSGYDNGYDGDNINAKGQANIYTNEPFGKMEVSCSNNIDSMYIGLTTGADSIYTLTFGAICGEVYLKDLCNDSIFQMQDGQQYTFHATPHSTHDLHFQLLLHPEIDDDYTGNGNSGITTDITDVSAADIWEHNRIIYIANAPSNSIAKIYAVSGQLIFSSIVQNITHTIDINHLPQGVYILRLNNQMYKFIAE